MLLPGPERVLSGDVLVLAEGRGRLARPLLGQVVVVDLAIDGQMLQVRADGYRLQNGDYLLVGQDTATLRQMNALILRTFAVEIVITLILAALGTAIVSMTVLKRVDSVNRTARAIMAGEGGGS